MTKIENTFADATARDVKAIVTSNLNSAIEGGYDEILDYSVEDLIIDLQAYAADCEELTAEQMTPFVKEWLEMKRKPS